MDKVKIVALGGLDEMYKSCMVIEINDDIFVVECGMKFPDIAKPGIDYIIPRTDYLVENKHRVKGYFLSYGHDSVIGGIPHIVQNVPAPVYGSDVTKVFLEMFCKHNHLDFSKIDYRTVNKDNDIVINGRKITFFPTCTNIANSLGFCFHTDQGNIVYISNTVFDNANDKGFALDLARIAKMSANQETLVLLCDSFYSDHPGYSNPKYRILPSIQKNIKEDQGRIICALESPDIYNISTVLNEAVKCGRKIILYDDSTKDIVNAMIETKIIDLKDNAFLDMTEVNRVRSQEVFVLMTAFGSKLYNKVAILAAHLNDEQLFKINENDTFILATHAEKDSQIAEATALDELYRAGCKVLAFNAKTFLIMHSSEEDLKTLLSFFKPKYYIPINGSLVKLFANAKLALGMKIGLSHNNVFVLDNGVLVEFENGKAKFSNQKILTGNVYVDGKGVGDIEAGVLAERQQISSDGVVIIGLTISKSKREIVLGPDIQTRGLVFVKESEALMKEINRVLVLCIKQELAKVNYSISYMEMVIKEQIFKTIRRSTLKSPTIIPIISQIE